MIDTSAWLLRGAGLVVSALLLCADPCQAQSADCLAASTPAAAIDMRVLLVSADGTEAVFPAIKQTLDYLGIPYDTLIAKNQVVSTGSFCGLDGLNGHGRYQAVLLTTGNLGFYDATSNEYLSALTPQEWQLLWQYEAKYRVRQATYYTIGGQWPDAYGLNPPTSAVDTSASPLAVTLTATSPAGSTDPSGQQVFWYLQPNAQLVVQNAYAYLSTPAAGASVTPLLVDAQGDAIASITSYPDGRQNLAVTVDANPYLLHAEAMAYGILQWVTKGIFVGQGKVYLTAQPDDVLIEDSIWDVAALSDQTGLTYRITGNDFLSFVAWQNNENQIYPGNSIALDIPFCGFGTTLNYDPALLYPDAIDTLTPVVSDSNPAFTWLSHTFDHQNLDAISYVDMLSELQNNDTVALQTLGLSDYQRDAMVTPEVSGLTNPAALQAMRDYGIRYVVSNSSVNCGNPNTNGACPTPNVGIYNALQPDILMIPRYPANLYYNVYAPDQWASEYNDRYLSFWGRNLTAAEVLDKESSIWLHYLVTFDLRPVMFHQSNMAAYDGVHSLLGDLINATLTKYAALFNLPVGSLPLDQIGPLMVERMNLNAALSPSSGSPLVATIVPGVDASSIVLTNPTSNTVVVPITGVAASNATLDSYAGQSISRLSVGGGGGTVTVIGAPAW